MSSSSACEADIAAAIPPVSVTRKYPNESAFPTPADMAINDPIIHVDSIDNCTLAMIAIIIEARALGTRSPVISVPIWDPDL